MAIKLDILGAVGRVRAAVKASLTASGDAPAALPLTTTAAQSAEEAAGTAVTVIQVKSAKIAFGDDCPQAAVRIRLPIVVHHIRPVEADTGSAAETGLARMAALGVLISNDFKLETVRQDPDVLLIELAEVTGLDSGDDNPVQMMLDATNQNTAQVAVSLLLNVTWVEE